MNWKNSSANMRGLARYISELETCQSHEAQNENVRREMEHVRSKLTNASKSDGYEMKKSMAKVLFTHLQGYPVDLSYLEPLSLMSSSKYSEKQMGYLALSIMLRDRSDIPAMVLPIIRKDLASLNDSDTCLALQAVSGMAMPDLAKALGEEVLKLLISPTSSVHVRKKAALTALAFFRLDPLFVAVATWVDRLALLLQHRHHGLAQCVSSLATALVQHAPWEYPMFYRPAVEQLCQIQLEKDHRLEYMYHRVPAPWLQVQLLALLRVYPKVPDEAQGVEAKLHNVFTSIWKRDTSHTMTADVHESNALYAVQLEAIRLAVHLDPSSYVVTRSAANVGRLLTSPQSNVRYLAMEVMTLLAQNMPSLQPIQLHSDMIFVSLSDKDISVRRRALDLLYAICDRTNVREIVQRLLEYLCVADASLRQDMTFKISLLAEQHASESTWYIDTTLELFHLAGKHVDYTVWHRIVQVVTNHPKVHEYAAKRIMVYMQQALCYETLVMLGAYLLGEYGFLISDHPGCRPLDQFHLLHRHMASCSPRTQAMCMSTYAKWAGMYPDVQDLLLDVLQRHMHVLDVETRQRAAEYVMLIQLQRQGHVDLQDVLDELPPFNATQFRGTQAPSNELFKPNRRISAVPVVSSVRRGEARRASRMPDILPDPDVPSASVITPSGLFSSDVSVDLVDLQSLHLESPSLDPANEQHPWASTSDVLSPQSPLLEHASHERATFPTTNSQHLYLDLPFMQLFADQGKLYEGYGGRLEYERQHTGDASVTCTLHIHNMDPSRVLHMSDIQVQASIQVHVTHSDTINPQGSAACTIEFVCHRPFDDSPQMDMTWHRDADEKHVLHMVLPVSLVTFIRPWTMDRSTFFEHWHAMRSQPELEAQRVCRLTHMNDSVFHAAGLAVLANIDARPQNVVAAGRLPDAIPVLVRWEPSPETHLARLTVRASHALAAQTVHTMVLRYMDLL